jgi:hypothetical protein
LALAALALAGLAIATLPPSSGPAASSRGIAKRFLDTGISDPVANALGRQVVFDRVRRAGAVYTRLTVLWAQVAPDQEPLAWSPGDPADLNYDWRVADREVRMAQRAGLEPLFQIYGAPEWAQRCGIRNESGAPCDPDPAALAQFARAAARRYSGDFRGLPRVRFWEPQNEPNLSLFFNPQMRGGKPVSPALYRRLLNRFAAAVKQVDPTNRVVTAGLAPLERPGNVGPLDFARRMLCMRGRERPRPTAGDCGGGVRFDVFAMNPFTTGSPTHRTPGPDDVSLSDLPELQRLLRAAERAGRIRSATRRVPLWVTEFSWDSRPPDPGGVPEKLHARWTAEAIYRAWAAGVSTFFWYELRDNPRNGRPHEETVQSGLYLRRGDAVVHDRPKMALRAFRFPFVAFARRGGVFVWGRTPTSEGGNVVLQARVGRGWSRIGSARANEQGIFRTLLRTSYGRGGRGAVRAVYREATARPFSLRRVPDFYQPPFG